MRAFLFMIPHFSYTDLYDIATTAHGGRLSVNTTEEAFKWCEGIARSHYENFPVASLLLPRTMRKHVIVIYAFSRIADDIADEYSLYQGGEKAEYALAIMHHFCKQSQMGVFKGKNPLWLAMQSMFEKTTLPIAPFERLLSAFVSDIRFAKPNTFQDILDYCDNSANPIGELLLRLLGNWNAEIKKESDALCTALQIINFIQDISIDTKKGRSYIPLEYADSHEIVENYLAIGEITPNFSKAVIQYIQDAELLLKESKHLPWTISHKGVRTELLLIHCSGSRMLNKCIRNQNRLTSFRPKLIIGDYILISLEMMLQIPKILFKR